MSHTQTIQNTSHLPQQPNHTAVTGWVGVVWKLRVTGVDPDGTQRNQRGQEYKINLLCSCLMHCVCALGWCHPLCQNRMEQIREKEGGRERVCEGKRERKRERDSGREGKRDGERIRGRKRAGEALSRRHDWGKPLTHHQRVKLEERSMGGDTC